MDDLYLASDQIPIDIVHVTAIRRPSSRQATVGCACSGTTTISLYAEITDPTRADRAEKLDSSTDSIDFFLCTDSYVKGAELKDTKAADVAQFRANPYLSIDEDPTRAAS